MFLKTKQKHHLFYSLLTVDDKNNQSCMAAATAMAAQYYR